MIISSVVLQIFIQSFNLFNPFIQSQFLSGASLHPFAIFQQRIRKAFCVHSSKAHFSTVHPQNSHHRHCDLWEKSAENITAKIQFIISPKRIPRINYDLLLYEYLVLLLDKLLNASVMPGEALRVFIVVFNFKNQNSGCKHRNSAEQKRVNCVAAE